MKDGVSYFKEQSAFVMSLVALLASIIIVHGSYVAFVDPQAAALLARDITDRSFVVIIKDAEQEICFMAMLWCSYLILSKSFTLYRDQFLFSVDFLAAQGSQSKEGQSDGELDLQEALKTLEQSQYRNKPLLQAWITCIRRYIHTKDVQNASDAIQASVSALAVRLEAGNSMIRYLIWAIPSIGFIGTVRGIGAALAQADAALAGDISGMTQSLGLAFNSTLVALFISIILMFLLHQLQRLQDGLVVETQAHCEKYLLKHLH